MWLPGRLTVAAGAIASIGVADCTAADSSFIDIVTTDKPPPPQPKNTCDADTQCPPMMPYCDAPRMVCVECAGDAGCADPKRPACMPDMGACVECASDAECAAPRPHCDITAHKCVECLNDENCPMGQTCDPMQHCAP